MFTEGFRRATAFWAMLGGWFGALGVLLYGTLSYDPNHMHFAPEWVSLAFIGLLGVAIGATTARARMRLSDTIVQAFRAGMQVQGNKPPKDE